MDKDNLKNIDIDIDMVILENIDIDIDIDTDIFKNDHVNIDTDIDIFKISLLTFLSIAMISKKSY